MPLPIPCPKRTQLRPSQRCTSLASLPRSKLSWEICAGWVHDQLWQKPLWKEIKECARVDYRGAVSENDGGSFPHSESKFWLRGILSRKWACGAAGSALPWHGRGRRFDPDQVHQFSQRLRQGESPQ